MRYLKQTPTTIGTSGSYVPNVINPKDSYQKKQKQAQESLHSHHYNPLSGSKANLDSKRNLNTKKDEIDHRRHGYVPAALSGGSKSKVAAADDVERKDAVVVSSQYRKYVPPSKTKIDVGSRRALFDGGHHEDGKTVVPRQIPTKSFQRKQQEPPQVPPPVVSPTKMEREVVKKTARTPEQEAAALRIQSFIRGSLCRARVSAMILKLIEELMAEHQEAQELQSQQQQQQQQASSGVEAEEATVDHMDEQAVFAKLDVPGEDIPQWWMECSPHAILPSDEVDEAYAVIPPPAFSYNDVLIIKLVKSLLGGQFEDDENMATPEAGIAARVDEDYIIFDDVEAHGVFAALDVGDDDNKQEEVQQHKVQTVEKDEEDEVEELIQLSVKRCEIRAESADQSKLPEEGKKRSVTFVEEQNQVKEIERVTKEARLPQWWMDHCPHAILPYDEADDAYAVLPPSEWSDDEEEEKEEEEEEEEVEEEEAEGPESVPDHPTPSEKQETSNEDEDQEGEGESQEWRIDDVMMKRSSSQSYNVSSPAHNVEESSEQQNEPDVAEMSLADRMKAFQKGPETTPVKRGFRAATFR
jgi:hypothetical protein